MPDKFWAIRRCFKIILHCPVVIGERSSIYHGAISNEIEFNV